MSSTARPTRPVALGGALFAAAALLFATASPAAADPVGSGEASAYGGTISVGGQEAIPPTPLAETSLGAEDVSETLVDIPAEPLAVSGTLNADAAVHADSDIESQLTQVTQEVEGPYNASGVALIEGAEVLIDSIPDMPALVTADVIRAEAVAVCRGGAVDYSANSEVINLNIGGQDVPLNEPLTQVLDQLNDVLEQTTLNQVVDIQRNVVTPTDDGIAVDALVVTVLSAAADAAGGPLAEVRLGHAEVSGVGCGAATQCSDGIDNDDPEDELADEADPGCHTDGDASNPASYDPADDSELDVPTAEPSEAAAPPSLPRTGGDAATTTGLAALMGAGALGLYALRRKLT